MQIITATKPIARNAPRVTPIITYVKSAKIENKSVSINHYVINTAFVFQM